MLDRAPLSHAGQIMRMCGLWTQLMEHGIACRLTTTIGSLLHRGMIAVHLATSTCKPWAQTPLMKRHSGMSSQPFQHSTTPPSTLASCQLPTTDLSTHPRGCLCEWTFPSEPSLGILLMYRAFSLCMPLRPVVLCHSQYLRRSSMGLGLPGWLSLVPARSLPPLSERPK